MSIFSHEAFSIAVTAVTDLRDFCGISLPEVVETRGVCRKLRPTDSKLNLGGQRPRSETNFADQPLY